ncbi:peroxisomal membrane protein PEX14 [Acyrthosiphon pisum]|uniref:Peroxisomal membrane protein PEX14 n=1 Tax=Acyrthosiphon pisum TaxID=7029 RepID=A0A8R2A6F6_ACYPI|nr:peroxisomal membrane protein PEX14 [Acyrthosiphon pisum]|eukprot:XP_003246804.1 PREDICTED: peroxisomal membrane protein PEX14 [Acyrthosiphon pisum]
MMSHNDDKVNSDDNSVAVNAVVNSGDCSAMNNPNTANMAKSTSNNLERNIMVANNSKMPEPIPTVRKSVVAKAIEFLVLESVQKMPTERKINFLSKKGLTDVEIQYSIQRAAMICYDNQSLNKQNQSAHNNSSNAPGAIQTSFESQSWYSRLFGPIAFAAAVVYIGYKLYKKYIESWLFGAQKTPLENRLETIELSVQRCIMMLEEKDNLLKSSNTYADRQKEFNIQVRAELKSIKSLLLNRFQFPPAPASSSIPEWQLLKNTKSQVEQQDKINNSDVPNSLQTSEKSILNETQKNPVVDAQLNGLNGSDNDKDCITINSTSNETPLPTSSNQNLITPKNMDDENDSEHIENNEGINK